MINSWGTAKRYSAYWKRLFIFVVIFLLFQADNSAQTCLPDGITFSTQAEIDNFSINYPGCTTILGDVSIDESVSGMITSLAGLSQLNAIGGTLEVRDNAALTSLSGLDNVTSIGGDFWVGGDFCVLQSFSGLDNLSSIGGSLLVLENDQMVSMSALGKLTSVGRDINIWANSMLEDLYGLENLTTINGYLEIRGNYALTSLSGLENVTSIGGYLEVNSNSLLTNLNGLNNVTIIGGDLEISTNAALTNLGGLDNVTAINGGLWIYNNPVLINLGALGQVTSFGGDLRIKLNASLTNLNGLDNVASVGGQLELSSNAVLSSLAALNKLTSVGDQLVILNNDNLLDLSGLNNLTFIAGRFSISNNAALSSLSGLEKVTTIGGNLSLYNNAALSSISSLNNVTSINGSLSVRLHPSLTSLSGLENIDPTIITDLIIENSSNLAICGVESICKYLENPTNSATISGNAPGCSSLSEVRTSCGLCLPGGITFTTQASIDDFAINYPGCSKIIGSVTISGANITNLNGLENLMSIGGSLSIYGNDALVSLDGLEHLISVGLSLDIVDNPLLSSLDGLDNIVFENINPQIEWNIINCPNLSFCETPSVCRFLAEGGDLFVENNGLGCNSITEIIANCGSCTTETTIVNDNPIPDNTTILASDWIKTTGFIEAGSTVLMQAQNYILLQAGFQAESGSEVHLIIGDCSSVMYREGDLPEYLNPDLSVNNLMLYPNPASGDVNIQYELNEVQQVNIYLQSLNGQGMRYLLQNAQQETGQWEFVLEISHLPPGAYVVILKTEYSWESKKLIVVK